MKRKLLAIAALTVSTLMSGSVLAQGYIGASVGLSDADLDCAGTTSCDNKDTAFKLFGGYMFTPNFGVEGAWVDLGKARAGLVDPVLGTVSARFKSNGLAVYGVAAAPIDRFVLFGKLGVASLKARISATSSTLGAGSDSETNTTVAFGLGGAYHVTKNFGVRVEWERYQPKYAGEKVDVDVLSAGVQYRF